MEEVMENLEPKTRPLGRRIFIGAVKLILYVAFVAAAIYFLPKVLAKSLHTNYPLATITSGSMWPALNVNDLILMKGISADQAQVGQVIVFKNVEQGFTIHRLIRIQDDGKLVTKGDANDIEDPSITGSDVIGRIVYIGHSPLHIPYLGIIARGLGPKIHPVK